MIPQNAGQALTPNLKIGYQIDEALQLHTNFNKDERDKKISELLNKVKTSFTRNNGIKIST